MPPNISLTIIPNDHQSDFCKSSKLGGPSISNKKGCLPTILFNFRTNIPWVDDWEWYHTQLGEVHCGSNTVRKPIDRWWEYE